jgi:hypothetical protein
MPEPALPEKGLTEYERAVCYYSLPRLVSPISYALIVAYGVCLFEAIAAMAVGIVIQDDDWLTLGAICTVAMVVFGVVVFTCRAFLNEFRRRRLLAEAHNAPKAARNLAEDVPDPFAEHILVQHPDATKGNLFNVTDAGSDHDHVVEMDPHHFKWVVRDPNGSERFQIRALSGLQSFSFGPNNLPSRLGVFKGTREIARISNRWGLWHPRTEIVTTEKDALTYQVRADGIYVDDRLIGRIYYLRHAYYLDVQSQYYSDGLLAYFVTVS